MGAIAIPFFATARDLASLLSAVAAERPLSFAAAGMFEEAPTSVLTGVDGSIPLKSYLMFDRDRGVRVEPVPQDRGPMRYAVDQKENPHTVALQYGGQVDESRLIASQVGTISTDPASEQIYSLCAAAIYRSFETIKAYSVGPEAARLLDTGVRLMSAPGAPPAYDLARR